MTLVLRRLPLLALLLATISAAVFALTQALPGDPAFIAAGGGAATPEMIAPRARAWGSIGPSGCSTRSTCAMRWRVTSGARSSIANR
jgi:hypothetical protein